METTINAYKLYEVTFYTHAHIVDWCNANLANGDWIRVTQTHVLAYGIDVAKMPLEHAYDIREFKQPKNLTRIDVNYNSGSADIIDEVIE